MPEKLLTRLLDDSNPVGWSIGDQVWDHLFSGSTDFFQKVDHSKSTEAKKKFHSFDQLIELLQGIE